MLDVLSCRQNGASASWSAVLEGTETPVVKLTEAESHQRSQGKAPVDGGELETGPDRGQGGHRSLDQERVDRVWTCSPQEDRR